MRLIDADALLKALRVNEDEWGTPDETWKPEREYGEAIKIAPTIKAEKQGEWVKVYGDHMSMGSRVWWLACSNCGRIGEVSRYCPNCGAKMVEK